MTTAETDIKQITTEPGGNFALLDLAQRDDKSLLSWLYSYFGNTQIEWEPLYNGSELQEIWNAGPILIALEQQNEFRSAFIERCEKEPLGILLNAPGTELAVLAKHLKSHVTAELDGKSSLFRFYDPRSLGPLLKVLQPNQSYQLMGASQWCWCHDGQWWATTESQSADWPEPEQPLVIGKAQLDALGEARLAQFAASLTDYYRPHIPAPDPEQFVLAEIRSADESGVTLLADQERWVRLAIQAGVSLTESTNWKHLANDQGLSPSQILTHLESEQRTVAHVD
ncbi:DUF4123 domain-containing protein [Marinobacter lipolyticus]|uniref:DUF4123 domain-containing protein n=1 Tax=Marinobacter lipolyticus TaxID=209639 RepID=UPI001BCF6EBE|nr:DUF4123 domain-containing protein [Marinobacter lipolyticus]MBS8239560.1 DUF4123 domain-containing protein [Marinobacter lipolyticus]